MADWAAIETEIEAMLAADGFELIELEKVLGRSARVVILADKADQPSGIGLDDCAAISRQVARYLDVVDPFQGPYHLLVSSPGFDRPLARLAHCERAMGRKVRVKHRRDGRSATVEGRLLAVEGELLVLDRDGERETIGWPEVVKANVVYEWPDE